MSKKLLGIGTDAKTVKGEAFGFLTGICYLAPSNESGELNTCPFASKGCRLACLYTAGMGVFDSVKKARVEKTLWFHRERESFMATLVTDITRLVKSAARKGLTPAVRLNGTSDIAWETVPFERWQNIMAVFPEVQFYDYTANHNRAYAWARGEMPSNYHLTLSRKENNHAKVVVALERGCNVAVVFATDAFPATYLGKPVIDGDKSDLRFADARNVVVGLKAKGKAKKDLSGFVVHPDKEREFNL